MLQVGRKQNSVSFNTASMVATRGRQTATGANAPPHAPVDPGIPASANTSEPKTRKRPRSVSMNADSPRAKRIAAERSSPPKSNSNLRRSHPISNRKSTETPSQDVNDEQVYLSPNGASDQSVSTPDLAGDIEMTHFNAGSSDMVNGSAYNELNLTSHAADLQVKLQSLPILDNLVS